MTIIKLNRFIELLLFMLLTVFIFSFERFTIKWNILFGIVLGILVLSLIFERKVMLGNKALFFIIPIVFLVIFDFAEQVNFSQLFDMQSQFGWRIPLSTIILSVIIFFFMIKLLLENKFIINLPKYLKYIVISFVFIFILMVLFYPLLYLHYDMNLNSNIQLLTKMLKFSILLIVISSLSNNKSYLNKLNVGLILSISIGLFLNIIF